MTMLHIGGVSISRGRERGKSSDWRGVWLVVIGEIVDLREVARRLRSC